MSFFPNIDTDAIRTAGFVAARATTSFGVQALRLLSDIKDNTSETGGYERRIITVQKTAPGQAPVMRIPAGNKPWILKGVNWSDDAQFGFIVYSGTDLAACGFGGTQNTTDCNFPMFPGSEITLLGSDKLIATITYDVPLDNDTIKPGPWNVNYRSVDNVGVLSSIHLDGWPVNGSYDAVKED